MKPNEVTQVVICFQISIFEPLETTIGYQDSINSEL